MRQLQLCYEMYCGDNKEYLPRNCTHPNAVSPPAPSWIEGNAQTDVSPYWIIKGVLYQYNKQYKIYACPANAKKVGPVTPADVLQARQAGVTLQAGSYVPQTRTCSINFALAGCGPYTSPGDKYSAGGASVRSLVKASDVRRPSRTICFADEAANSVDDGCFGMWPASQTPFKWWNLPGSRHDNGTIFSFVDSHAKYWHWHGSGLDSVSYWNA